MDDTTDEHPAPDFLSLRVADEARLASPGLPPGTHVLSGGDDEVDLETETADDADSRSAALRSPGAAVANKRIAFVGRLGGMNRREAANLVRSYAATVVEGVPAEFDDSIDIIVIGAEEPPLSETDLLDESTRSAAAAGTVEIVHETDLWHRLGLVDVEQSIRQYYTPAMLSHLLGISVRVIRRWQRLGLITPVRTLHKLPFFDFQEVATARRLAQWVAAGASPKAIERRLVELVEFLPDIQRPLDQLSVLVEGKHVLLRQGEGLVEPGGQLRFDFDSLESGGVVSADRQAGEHHEPENVLSFAAASETAFPLADSPRESEDTLLQAAYAAEDAGDLPRAIDYYHTVLARDGARPDICFQLGELLYRTGEPVAARERYFMAIEIDPEFVEARASLGSVMAELDQHELAVAAFRGALSLYPDYAEVHYSLARTLDDLDRPVEAEHHWKRFLQLSPESPWAGEASERLSRSPQ